MKRRTLRILAGAAMLALAVLTSGDQAPAADPKPGVKRMLMVNNGEDPYWDAMRAGIAAAQSELKLDDEGLLSVMDPNDATDKGQIDKLKQYLSQPDVGAVSLSVINAKNPQIAASMKALRARGIPVLAVDSDVDRKINRAARFAYIGTDNVEAGRELGKAGKALVPEGGKFVCFVGLKSAGNAIERIRGVGEGLGSKFKQVEVLDDNFDRNKASSNVKDALNRNPDVKVLVGIYAYNAHAIAQEVKRRKLQGKVKVIVFDAAPQAVADMGEGLIDAMVVQNPYEMGFLATKLMRALMKKDKAAIAEMLPKWNAEKDSFPNPDDDLIVTGLRMVYPGGEAKSPLTKDLFGPRTEFLPLDEFQKWLAKYKLQGS